MNKVKHRRRWSFVKPVRSEAFLFWEALAAVGGIVLLTFLPFRYSVRYSTAAPLRSNGIFQLGRELSANNEKILNLRDPAAVLNTHGQSGYLSCLPQEEAEIALPGESVAFPETRQSEITFHLLTEKDVPPAPPLPDRITQTPSQTAAGVMMRENGERLAEITLPQSIRSPGGQTIIRLTGGKELPRSELLASCGSPELDKLALQRSRKINRKAMTVITVIWPQQRGTFR